jgi:hypothetical protein
VPITGRLAVGPFGPQGSPAAAVARNGLPGWNGAGAVGLVSLVDIEMGAPGRGAGARPTAAGRAVAPAPWRDLPGGARLARPQLLGAYADTARGSAAVLFVVDSSGWITAVRPAEQLSEVVAYGASYDLAWDHLPGFPFQLPSPPAGLATLGDISGDGRPCILVQCRDGLFYAIGMDGRPLPGFPARLPGGRAPMPGASALQYRDLSGTPVILVPTTSGDLVGLNARGKVVPGFPLSVASRWGTGAFFTPGDRGNTWLFSAGGDGGFSLDSLPGVLRTNWVSLGPGVDEARSGFLPRSRVAPAKPATVYADLGNFRAYPNPVRVAQQGELRVSFDLTRPASVRVRLYSLSGRIMSERRWAGHVAGNVVAIPAASLGSGLYHVEVVVEGTDKRLVTPVAVVQ